LTKMAKRLQKGLGAADSKRSCGGWEILFTYRDGSPKRTMRKKTTFKLQPPDKQEAEGIYKKRRGAIKKVKE